MTENNHSVQDRKIRLNNYIYNPFLLLHRIVQNKHKNEAVKNARIHKNFAQLYFLL